MLTQTMATVHSLTWNTPANCMHLLRKILMNYIKKRDHILTLSSKFMARWDTRVAGIVAIAYQCRKHLTALSLGKKIHRVWCAVEY
jgi:hypothetical protein